MEKKWRRIGKGETIPTNSIIRPIDGGLPNIAGSCVTVGQDCYYLSVDDAYELLKGLPLETETEAKEMNEATIIKKLIGLVKETEFLGEENRTSLLDWLEKQGEKKPADKVEPKFKVGDIIERKHNSDINKFGHFTITDIFENCYWYNDAIICDISEQDEWEISKFKTNFDFKVGQWIVATGKCIYCITKIDGFNVTLVDVDNNEYVFDVSSLNDTRLWTIQDAKDGDVLEFEGNYNSIALFQGIGINGEGRINYHCKCDLGDYSFGVQGDVACLGTIEKDAKRYHPATKERRDLLFAKMKEACYKWDAEKKELKKIEQKPAWSEEDEKYSSYICAALQCYYRLREDRNNTNGQEDLDKARNWLYNRLKSLRPQNNATDEELAQAKKDAYNDALDKIEYHSGEPTFDDGWSAAIWYLKKKNAQPQNTWKPSDEQIEALEHFVRSIGESGYASPYDSNTKLVCSLFNDLKKLREE